MSIFAVIFAIGWACGVVTGAGVACIVREVRGKCK